MPDREGTYRLIWAGIKKTFLDGFIVSERGLQAALYAELREIPGVNVVVEPTWKVEGKRRTPDLVIVEEYQITDIFELKFKPDGDPSFEEDIRKLLQYGIKEKDYLGELDPDWGWRHNDWSVRNDCRLHFVAVANYKADAVRPTFVSSAVRDLKEKNLELNENPRALSHWFGDVKGYTEENEEEPIYEPLWGIEFGIR